MQIQSVCKALGEGGCLYFTYGAIVGIHETELIARFPDFVKLGFVDADGFVQNPQGIFRHYGITATVEKRAPDQWISGRPYAALYQYTDELGRTHGHWVKCLDGEIVWNSLDRSECVRRGKCTSIRVVSYY